MYGFRGAYNGGYRGNYRGNRGGGFSGRRGGSEFRGRGGYGRGFGRGRGGPQEGGNGDWRNLSHQSYEFPIHNPHAQASGLEQEVKDLKQQIRQLQQQQPQYQEPQREELKGFPALVDKKAYSKNKGARNRVIEREAKEVLAWWKQNRHVGLYTDMVQNFTESVMQRVVKLANEEKQKNVIPKV
jgi:hypothetical protein